MIIEEYQVIPKKIYFDNVPEGEWFVLADDLELEMPIMGICQKIPVVVNGTMRKKFNTLRLGIEYGVSHLHTERNVKVYRVQIKSIQFRFLDREDE